MPRWQRFDRSKADGLVRDPSSKIQQPDLPTDIQGSKLGASLAPLLASVTELTYSHCRG
jgi:hypothetical protein